MERAEFALWLRSVPATQFALPVEVHLRAVLKRLLRTHGFECIGFTSPNDPELRERVLVRTSRED